MNLKITRYLIAGLLIAAVVLALPQAPASAASRTKTSQTVTITEDQINSSHWITNPAHPFVTNKHVTLGDSIVTISATLTHGNKVFDASSVWKPYVTSKGLLVFGFQSVTVITDSATAAEQADESELRLAHQHIVHDAIRDYVRSQVGGPFKYTSISVTPGLVTITVDVYSK